MRDHQDVHIGRMLVQSDLGSRFVGVQTERNTGEVTWAKFKGPDGSFTVEPVWGVESTLDDIVSCLITEAHRILPTA